MIHNSKTKQRKLRNERNYKIYVELGKIKLEKNEELIRQLKDEQLRYK